MKVTMIAHTIVIPGAMADATNGDWETDCVGGHDASHLTEFAGRACYESWSKPNPATATNMGYVANILGHEHFSVAEHGSVTFAIGEVSRSLTHELIRHRHASYSQLSQRFVVLDGDASYVTPPLYNDATLFDLGGSQLIHQILETTWVNAVANYEALVELAMPRLVAAGMTKIDARKRAREAARCVLPNMTPTKIVMTGNHRAWRELIEKRATEHADAEICALAVALFAQLSRHEPALYQDMAVTEVGGRYVVVRAK